MRNGNLAVVYSLACALLLSGCNSTTSAQKILGDLEDLGFPTPSQTSESGTGSKVAGGLAGCSVGGAAGYFGVKYASDRLKEEGYSSSEIGKAATFVAGLGCIIGGSVAVNIIKNMDAESRKAQDEAWAIAQSQSQAESTTTPSPQAWKTDTYEGTVEILEPVTTPDGQQCATRRNYVKSPQGEGEQFIAVCKNSSGIYEATEA